MFPRLAFANLLLTPAAAVLVGIVAIAPAADAATYLLKFTSSGGDLGSVTFNLTGSTATSASGLINGSAVTGLSAYAGADQQLFVAGPVHFDIGGLSFGASNGVFYNLTSYPYSSDAITNSARDPYGNGSPTPFALTSISVAAVPVPASLGMMLLGLGALAFGLRKRRGDTTGATPA